MKKLSEINEGTLWGNTIMRSDTDKVRKEDEITEEHVRSFLHDNWKEDCKTVTIRKENGKPVVDIEGDYFLKEDITEIPFQFGKVSGIFACICCSQLTSLNGCPEEVGASFSCAKCNRLTSLEGCPKKVDCSFYCNECGRKFTKEEVKQLCTVKRSIIV